MKSNGFQLQLHLTGLDASRESYNRDTEILRRHVSVENKSAS